MHYQFPVINHLNDVLPAIEGRKEFVVAQRDGFTVVNYVVAMDDTFPPIKVAGGSAKQREERSLHNSIRRELRGIIFDSSGAILSRRLHKFFNVNEREETLVSKIDWNEPHVILEKLDGSMITPIVINGVFRWGTKMGITDVAAPVEEWVNRNLHYVTFANYWYTYDHTPIFEWCSRKQRIVVDHPVDRLVLIAIRNNKTGEYLSYEDMKHTAYLHSIEVVKAFPGNVESMQHLIDSTKELENAEGWVVRFNDGHMLKVKGDWYLRIHKTKDGLSQEKNIIEMIVNGTLDDAKSYMLEDDRKRVEEFEHNFWKGFNDYSSNLAKEIMHAMKVSNYQKKDFALGYGKSMSSQDRSIAFNMWDKDANIDEEMLHIIKKNLGSQSKVDSVRHMWQNHRWNYGGIES